MTLNVGLVEGGQSVNTVAPRAKIGIDLRTERPRPDQIRSSVEKILANDTYRKNIERLNDEFSTYPSNQLSAAYIDNLVSR